MTVLAGVAPSSRDEVAALRAFRAEVLELRHRSGPVLKGALDAIEARYRGRVTSETD